MAARMTNREWAITVAIAMLPALPHAAPQAPAASWLDTSVSTNWNAPGSSVPTAPRMGEAAAAILKRCQMPERRSTIAEQAVGSAGWTPFLIFDRELVNGDIEIIGGLAGADGMCRPMAFNGFVFVGGRFAGTLAPGPMDSRTDGTLGAVRILDANTVTAEFSRYTDRDALCCPSSRVSVTYRIDRSAKGPLVAPTSSRAIR